MPNIISTHISALYFCLILAIGLLGGSACRRGDSRATMLMDRAESLMEQRPDSALSTLDSITTAALAPGEQTARYALLRSMALDKNYIDTTDFSVLQPAIDYYLTKGTPDQKLRTYYYQGRIYQNVGNDDSAMQAFVNALDLQEKATDTLTLARTMAAQAIILKSVYDFDLYLKRRLESANLFGKMGYDKHRGECLIYALNVSLLAKNRQLADSLMQLCDKEYQKGNISKDEFLAQRILYTNDYGTKSELKEMLQSVNLLNGVTTDCLLNIINSYLNLGDLHYAKKLIEQMDEPSIPDEKMKYYGIYAIIQDSLQNYKNALSNYKTFYGMLLDENYIIFEHKLRSSEQRHSLELANQKESKAKNTLIHGLIIAACFLALSILILVFIVRNNRIKKELAQQREQNAILENEKLKSESEKLNLANVKLKLENQNLTLQNEKRELEAENLKHRVSKLEDERTELSSLLESSELPVEVRDAVKVRVEMLNGLLAGYITSNDKYEKPYEAWVSEITGNKEAFMNTNRLAFKASHPEFIEYFEKHGLTDDEINYVCLYAIGLRGKEVGDFMQLRRHYHISSDIRKKLGIDDHDTNIGIYIRKLLKQL